MGFVRVTCLVEWGNPMGEAESVKKREGRRRMDIKGWMETWP